MKNNLFTLVLSSFLTIMGCISTCFAKSSTSLGTLIVNIINNSNQSVTLGGGDSDILPPVQMLLNSCANNTLKAEGGACEIEIQCPSDVDISTCFYKGYRINGTFADSTNVCPMYLSTQENSYGTSGYYTYSMDSNNQKNDGPCYRGILANPTQGGENFQSLTGMISLQHNS